MTRVHFTRVLVAKFALTGFALRLLLMVLLSFFMRGSRSPTVPYLEVTALGEPRSWRREGGEGGGEEAGEGEGEGGGEGGGGAEGRREEKGEGEGKGGGRGEKEVG